MKTLVLSGWGQSPEGLSALIPGATAFDYLALPDSATALETLRGYGEYDAVVAWSLGGQLALRAVAAKVLRPRHLTLIAAPLRFVGADGMGSETFALFRASYAADPARTARRFHALLAKGDRHADQVMAALVLPPDPDQGRLLGWLDALGQFDGAVLELAHAPPTLIIHGMTDTIVPPAQAEAIARKLPRAELHRWAETAHAPHFSDPARLLAEIHSHRAAA